MAQIISVLPNVSDGLVDEFGNGLVENYAAEMFALPAAFAKLPQSQWYIAQWGQPIAIHPADYKRDSSSDDPNYGAALYSWSEPGTSSAIAIYRNTPAFGTGDVYDLTDTNTNAAPSEGATEEADMFLSSPAANDVALSHPITLSLDAKITQSLTQFASPLLAVQDANSGTVFGTFDIGITVNYNGADGLPAYVGFVQIVPWKSDTTAAADYQNAGLSPNSLSTQFISSRLMAGDPSLSLLPSDAGAAPDALSYTINPYVYASLATAFAGFSTLQQSYLLNLANWTLGNVYVGPATNDAQVTSQAGVTSMVATETVGIQVADISVTQDVAQTYDPGTVIAAAPAAIPAATIDTNPQIGFYDTTIQAGGTADGSVYNGPLTGIDDKYIYAGADNISLTAPAGANWEFGGGSGPTTLAAISGDNILVASSGGSKMTGGTGTDQFVVPDANITGITSRDQIVNFHASDTITLAGLAGPGWSYGWVWGTDQDGAARLTLIASSTLSANLNEQVTLAGLSMNDLSSLTIAPDGPGNAAGDGGLTITRNPQISSLDLNSGVAGMAAGTAISEPAGTDATGIEAEYLYGGVNSMAFMAPAGTNWEFGGGSAFTQLSAISGNNIFVASTGGSYMLGGSGDDRFDIPDANLLGAGVWDSIAGFHAGDTVALAGLAGAGWTFSWTGSYGSASNPALTLQANSTTMPGLSEFLTLDGLSINNLSKLSITGGAGADAGSLIVSG